MTHLNINKIKIKRTINYINLMKFPSFPPGCHPAHSHAALCIHQLQCNKFKVYSYYYLSAVNLFSPKKGGERKRESL